MRRSPRSTRTDTLFSNTTLFRSPDREKGELPLAFVEAAPGAVVDEAELVQYCRTAIPERAACPVAVIVLPGLPLTPVGKIFKPALRELRSEEHTSELQSLMRISYAVFCLKKKTKSIKTARHEH